MELTSKDDDGAAIIAQTSIWEVVLFHSKDLRQFSLPASSTCPNLVTRSFLPAH